MYIYVHCRANVAPGLKPRWTINIFYYNIRYVVVDVFRNSIIKKVSNFGLLKCLEY